MDPQGLRIRRPVGKMAASAGSAAGRIAWVRALACLCVRLSRSVAGLTAVVSVDQKLWLQAGGTSQSKPEVDGCRRSHAQDWFCGSCTVAKRNGRCRQLLGGRWSLRAGSVGVCYGFRSAAVAWRQGEWRLDLSLQTSLGVSADTVMGFLMCDCRFAPVISRDGIRLRRQRQKQLMERSGPAGTWIRTRQPCRSVTCSATGPSSRGRTQRIACSLAVQPLIVPTASRSRSEPLSYLHLHPRPALSRP